MGCRTEELGIRIGVEKMMLWREFPNFFSSNRRLDRKLAIQSTKRSPNIWQIALGRVAQKHSFGMYNFIKIDQALRDAYTSPAMVRPIVVLDC